MEKQRLDWVDMAKGASIILVVIYHATYQGGIYDPALVSYRVGQFSDVMRPIRMPLFFAVSGILSASALRRNWGDLLDRKCWFYVYLYGLWTAIWLIWFDVVITDWPDREPPNLTAGNLLKSFVAPTQGTWFIWALAIYFPLAKLLKPVRHLATPVVIAVSIVGAADILSLQTFAHRNLLAYACFFLIPAWYGTRLPQVIGRWPWAILIVGAMIFAVLEQVPPERSIGYGVVRTVQSLAGGSAALALCRLLERFSRLREVGCYFGKRTLPIYLSHSMLVMALVVIAASLPDMAQKDIVTVPIIALCATAGSLILHGIVRAAGLRFVYDAPHVPRRVALPAE